MAKTTDAGHRALTDALRVKDASYKPGESRAKYAVTAVYKKPDGSKSRITITVPNMLSPEGAEHSVIDYLKRERGAQDVQIERTEKK